MTWLLCSMLVWLLSSCMKEYDMIISQSGGVSWVKTGDVTVIGYNSATVTGSVDAAVAEDCGGISEFGIVYSTEQYDDWSGGMMVAVSGESASSAGYSVNLADLESGKTYFYAAYARTSDGMCYYGGRKNFVTLPVDIPIPVKPAVISKNVSDFGVVSSVELAGGNVNYEVGFCWKKVDSGYREPVLDYDESVNCGQSTQFEYTIPVEWTENVMFAVRAYIRFYDTSEVAYSQTLYVKKGDESFLSPSVVEVENGTTVTWKATAVNFVLESITEKGFCYSSPGEAEVKVVDATSGNSEFIRASIDNLDTENKFYYIRAYCVANGLTFYGPTAVYGTREPGIYSLEDLIAFRDARNADDNDLSLWRNEENVIKLHADIDMSGVGNWIPIKGISYNEIFDGQGHTLTNFRITAFEEESANYNAYGLFCTNSGTIKNLHIGENSGIDFDYEGGNAALKIGTICGYNESLGIVSGCTSAACVNVESKSNSHVLNLGGIAGDNYGTIDECQYTGSIIGQSTEACLGGIAARSEYGSTLSNCTNEGAVGGNLQSKYIGGIVGYAGQTNIFSCTNTGELKGHATSRSMGGIVGYCVDGYSGEYSLIDMCTNSATISGGNESVGGIAGELNGGVTNSVNSGAIVTSAQYAGSICGQIGSAVNHFVGNENTGTVNGVEGRLIGDDRRPPIVSDVTVVSYTTTTAVVTARILDAGGDSVYEAGIRYSTHEKYVEGTVTGTIENNTITLTLEGLVPGTKYYLWAYASNAFAISESVNSASFTTFIE